MKTKAQRFGLSLFTLSLLLPVGATWSLATVESRSRPPSAPWNAYPDEDVGGNLPENASLDLLRKMEFLQQEVQELRGKMEEQAYQLQQMQDHQKKLYLDLDQRMREDTSVKASAHVQEESIDVGQPLSKVTESESFAELGDDEAHRATEERSYQNAYRLVQSKDYDKAQLAFKSLLKTFPHGKYVPNAHYWLGEIYLSSDNLALASESFEIVYRQFPEHPKAADALLKLGYVEYAKGEWKRSQTLLSQVKKQFPGSTSAQLADARLQRIHQEGH